MILVGEHDLSGIVFSITWQERENDGASSLTFEYPAAKAGIFPNGSTVVFTHGTTKAFYGFLFSSGSDGRTVRCTAHDQLRYLRERVSLARQVEPVGRFVRRVLARAGGRIRVGEIADGPRELSARLFDRQSYLSMIYQSIEEYERLSGARLVLRDEFGAVTLRDERELRFPLIIGDGSLARGYRYERSIDSDSYNAVRLCHDSPGEGMRVVSAAEDPAAIERWGRLILWESLAGEANEAQTQYHARALLAQKNRETRSLTADCAGDLRARAGCAALVRIAAEGLDEWTTIKSAEHRFAGAKYTMRLELEQWAAAK